MPENLQEGGGRRGEDGAICLSYRFILNGHQMFLHILPEVFDLAHVLPDIIEGEELIYCDPPPGGDQDVLAPPRGALMSSIFVNSLYILMCLKLCSL